MNRQIPKKIFLKARKKEFGTKKKYLNSWFSHSLICPFSAANSREGNQPFIQNPQDLQIHGSLHLLKNIHSMP